MRSSTEARALNEDRELILRLRNSWNQAQAVELREP